VSIGLPDVPFAIGVPPVLRAPLALVEAYTALPNVADAPVASSDDWGIFDRSGQPIAQPDSVIALEYQAEQRIADYPMEEGGFQSYNKVAVPFSIRLALSKGGSVADRTAFLNVLEDLRASLDLVDVATPEKVYIGVNVTHAGMSRSATQGAGILTVEIMLQEIRQTVAVAYSTAPPAAAPDSATPDATTSAATSATAAKSKSGLPPAGASVKAIGGSWKTKVASAAQVKNQGAVQARAIGQAIGKGGAGNIVTPQGIASYVPGVGYKYDRPVR